MPANTQSEFLQVLRARGFVHQISDEAGLDEVLARSVVTAYVGFDCTAPSPHIGNLVGIMVLYWLQNTGHRPIVLVGGGTTRVGDPSGRDDSRQLLDLETIEANKIGIEETIGHVLRFGDGASDAILVDNADWLADLDLFGFLREVGRHFSVNQMIQRDSIRLRLDREQHLSFLEFSYMLLQAYDFVELNRRYDCRVQFGGSDQWGNIVSGVDLGRRLLTPQLYGLTTPLMTMSDGRKMGKSVSGAVWLNARQLSNHDYWQYWRNTPDADVARFLKIFTALPLDEATRLGALAGEEINEAKKVLANEATGLVRGAAAARQGASAAQATFEAGGIADDLPTLRIAMDELRAGIGMLEAFVRCGLCDSNGEVRRGVKGGAVRINGRVESDERRVLDDGDLGAQHAIKLSMGRKRHALIRPQQA